MGKVAVYNYSMARLNGFYVQGYGFSDIYPLARDFAWSTVFKRIFPLYHFNSTSVAIFPETKLIPYDQAEKDLRRYALPLTVYGEEFLINDRDDSEAAIVFTTFGRHSYFSLGRGTPGAMLALEMEKYRKLVGLQLPREAVHLIQMSNKTGKKFKVCILGFAIFLTGAP